MGSTGPTYKGVKYSIDPKYQQDIPVFSQMVVEKM